MITKSSEYMNQKQAMAYLGLSSVQTFYKLINAGLPCFVVGTTKRYSKKSIDDFMEEHKVVSST